MVKKVLYTVPFFVVLLFASRAQAVQPLPDHIKADKVVIDKSDRELRLICNGQVVNTYRVSLGRSPEGPKVRVDDCRTPEGEYFVDYRQPRSKYYKALHISYRS